jgi:hypothetical protein
MPGICNDAFIDFGLSCFICVGGVELSNAEFSEDDDEEDDKEDDDKEMHNVESSVSVSVFGALFASSGLIRIGGMFIDMFPGLCIEYKSNKGLFSPLTVFLGTLCVAAGV